MVVQGNVSRARRGTASRRKLAVLLGEVAAIALMAWSLPAVAAEADEAKATAGDEIIVTARRREENIQSVPVAVTAVTPTVLTEQHIVQASDLQVLAPSLTVTASSVSQGQSGSFNIRGQGQTFGGALPSVITYFAEVPLESQGGAAFGLYDIDSVQVVRGPQGTLFGRNTVGGAVLISPTAPKSEFGGYIDATFGNYGAREFKGAVDVPLGSTLSLRLAGNSVRRDDLTKNLTGHDFGNRHSDAWRVFLRWEPSTSFRNDLVYNGSYADEHGDAFVLSGLRPDKTAYIYNGGSRTATTLVPGSMVAEFQAQQLRGPRVVSDSQEGLGARRNIHLIVNTSTLKFGDASLKNIISYERVKVCYGSDLDGVDTRNSVSTCFPSTIGTNAGVASDPDVNLRQFTEELQLSGTAFDKMLDYQVGGFLLSASSPGGLDTFRVNRVTFSPSGQNLLYNLTVNQFADKSRGIYTQNTLHLGAERNISITAGLRYSWDTREASFGRLVSSPQTYNAPPPPFSSYGCTLPGVGASPATPATQCYRRLKNDYNGLSYTFGADWKVTPAVLLYATTRHSFKDGGFNTVVASGNNPAYDPEKATDYEIGLKSSFNAGSVSGKFNIAGFTGKYEGMQRQVTGGVPVTSIFVNVPKAIIKGIEIEASVRGGEFSLSGQYAYQTGRYTGFVDGGIDVSASQLLGLPEHSGSVTARWEHDLGDTAGTIIASGTFYATSRYPYIANNFVNYEAFVNAYQTLAARLEWRNVMGKPLDFALWGKNLANRQYIIGGAAQGGSSGITSYIYADPRTYGATLTARF